MKRLLPILCYIFLISCQDKVISAAYHSTYLLDKPTRDAYFSSVWQLDESTKTQYLATQQGDNLEDTLMMGQADTTEVIAQPKIDYYGYVSEKVLPFRGRKKNKSGIIKRPFYPNKRYRMRTVRMENMQAPKPIPEELVVPSLIDSLGMDSLSVDSLLLDSLETKPTIAREETKYLYRYDPSDDFNVEQQYYNKYFGKKLVDNSLRPKQISAPTDSLDIPVPDSLQRKESFFKRLFKKKKKEKPNDPEGESDTPVGEGEATIEEKENEEDNDNK